MIDNYSDLLKNKGINLWLDITTNCNAKCPQCHRTNANGLDKMDWLPIVQWTIEDFKLAFPVTTLQKCKQIQICGSWGDPLMVKDLFDIVSYILDNTKGIHILLNTNGSIRDEQWWWDFGIKVRNRTTVYWAIEGVTNEQHAHYRRHTDLNKILRNMDSFSAAGGISEVFTVVFKHNEKDIYNIAKLSRDHGAKQIMFVKSNRFYENMSYKFINELGDEEQLIKSTLPENSEFYWKSWDLKNSKHMEIIFNESIKAQ